MGADHDVHVAGAQAFADLVGLLGGDQARELGDPHGEALEAVAEVPVMLAAEQRGRHHDCHLIPLPGGDQGGAQGDLSLAEADIAADQAVHRPRGPHVVQHILDGLELVFRLGEGEAGAELVIGARRRVQRLGLAQLAFGGDGDQRLGHVEQPFLDPRLARLPARPAQLVELRLGLLAAVARQHVDVLDRHEQLVAAEIFQAQHVMGRAADLQGLQPEITADAVLGMDDVVALLQ